MIRSQFSSSTEYFEWLKARRHLARRFINTPCKADGLGQEIQSMPISRHDLNACKHSSCKLASSKTLFQFFLVIDIVSLHFSDQNIHSGSAS